MRMLLVILLAALLAVVWEASAHAYIDPGSGSYIFQILIAGFVGFAFTLKIYWKKIREFISKKFSK